MPYSHSFAAEFYYAEGEPYDRADLALNAAGNPISLYSAILKKLQDEAWRVEVLEALLPAAKPIVPRQSCPGIDDIAAFELLEMARRTDTCTNLSSPVEVWLDEAGDFRVEVYDE